MNNIKVGLSIGILCIGIGGLFILKELKVNKSKNNTPVPVENVHKNTITNEDEDEDLDMIQII